MVEYVCCICLKTSKKHSKIAKCEICVSHYPHNRGLYCDDCYPLHLELHSKDALKIVKVEEDNYIDNLQDGDETGLF